ncbi:mucin-19-like [Stegostoma tigrinum]|uniref:mucin-19-like n=1 Tax=Stegostoma tigrinum TaxID=3053191 RepID=UPI0028707531|nr:mucin-19-like [Stegostoma tigrinum]
MKYPIFLILRALSLLKDNVFAHQRIKRDYSMNNYDLDGSAVTQTFRYTREVSSSTYEGPRTCRTWGHGAIRTYTDDFYHMASTCNYILTRQCKGNTEDFNVEIQRGSNGNLEHIFMKIDSAMIVVANGTIMVKRSVISLPYDNKVINIQQYGVGVRFSNRRHTIVLFWNYQDELEITVDAQYQGQLCGLCGPFDTSASTIYDSDYVRLYKLDSSSCSTTFPKDTNCTSAQACSKISTLFTSCLTKAIEDKYLEMCQKDACACKKTGGCTCANFAEISHQCVHSDSSVWKTWRKSTGCAPPTCPGNQIYMECGPVCKSTCSDPNPQQQCDQCVNTCGCPEGTVLDNMRGDDMCISQMECPCEYDGAVYESGQIRNTFCQSCACQRGMWECADLNCPEICKIEEGTHITTFDGRYYNLIGDCSYYAIVTKYWSVKIEMHPCQLAYKQTCLQRVTYTKYQDSYVFNNDGTVDYNGNRVGVPLINGDIKIFYQSSIFLQVSTKSGMKMQIQIHPIMQLYISLPQTANGTTKGLCGTFNHNAEDDFLSAQGIVEYTYVAFANSWREGDNCPPPQVNPTCVSSEDEIYAKENCAHLKDPLGAFAVCHSVVDFTKYYDMCKVASCNCEKVNDCICAALGAYSHACAAKGVIVGSWRRSTCGVTCPSTQVFQYGMTACNRTCRFLSRPDITCEVQDVPVDGCGCPEGKYMNEKGTCVSRSECPCYFGGMIVQKDQPMNVNGAQCFCVDGVPSCAHVNRQSVQADCGAKIFSDCQTNSVCRKTCQMLNTPCPNPCVPGCVCPEGLVEDYNGNCILPEKCPCSYGDEIFNSGETIKSDCNDCTCKGGLWACTDYSCPKTCLVYGDGHYKTFDGKRYSYDGNCEYVIVEDQCQRAIGTFQILTESVPCCENGVTCSRNIRILFEDRELILLSGNGVTEVSLGKTQCTDNLYTLHTVGLYLVLTFSNGITVIWDKRTRLSITLDAKWKNKVCGLCGNFNDDIEDDLTTKWNYVVTSPVEFGNSWKISQSCSNTVNQTFPCDRNPYCLSWAQKRCNIIKGAVFQACHKKVDPTPYYEACVEEACACDMEGRYLGFCTAVAVYAEACNKVDVCIHWRTPDLCPVYCDYYNAPGECSWHYHPCGTLRTKTCSDHSIAKKLSANLEGCYAKCPESAPYLDENTMKCVTLPQCTCYYDGRILQPGEITWNDCEKCMCINGVTHCNRFTPTTVSTTVSSTSTPFISLTTSSSTIKSTETSTTTETTITSRSPASSSTEESTTTTGPGTTTETTASSTTGTTTTILPTTPGFTTASTTETTTTTETITTASSTASSTPEQTSTTVSATTPGSTTGSTTEITSTSETTTIASSTASSTTEESTTTTGTGTTTETAVSSTAEQTSTTVSATTPGSTTGSTTETTSTSGTTTTASSTASSTTEESATTTGTGTTTETTASSTTEEATSTTVSATTAPTTSSSITEQTSTTVSETTPGATTGSTTETTSTSGTTTTASSTASSTTEETTSTLVFTTTAPSTSSSTSEQTSTTVSATTPGSTTGSTTETTSTSGTTTTASSAASSTTGEFSPFSVNMKIQFEART